MKIVRAGVMEVLDSHSVGGSGGCAAVDLCGARVAQPFGVAAGAVQVSDLSKFIQMVCWCWKCL